MGFRVPTRRIICCSLVPFWDIFLRIERYRQVSSLSPGLVATKRPPLGAVRVRQRSCCQLRQVGDGEGSHLRVLLFQPEAPFSSASTSTSSTASIHHGVKRTHVCFPKGLKFMLRFVLDIKPLHFLEISKPYHRSCLDFVSLNIITS